MKQTVLKVLEFYIKYLSGYFGGGCRFTPSCSRYSHQAIRRFGVVKGFKLSFLRIVKCHPFSSARIDPVPNK